MSQEEDEEIFEWERGDLADMGYITYGEFDIDDVLPYTGNNLDPKEYVVRDKVFLVKMGSIRYKLFKKNKKCVSCGIEGNKFYLQNTELAWQYHIHGVISYPERIYRAHFNLYHISGNRRVLMTKDHINPVSKGGETRMINLQTMCAPCNSRKGDGSKQVKKIKKHKVQHPEAMQLVQV